MKKENDVPKAKPETTTKLETAKKTQKPKNKQTKTAKVVKTKKEQKVKPAKQKPKKEVKVKTQKPKKAKKTKKPKTLKQKLSVGVTIFVVLGLTIFGVGSVFTSNDFAMTLVFSQNAEKTINVSDKARQDLFAAPYIDAFITFEAKNRETGNVVYKTTLDIQLVHYDNTNTYEYASKTLTSTEDSLSYESYYLNGVFYQKTLLSGVSVHKTKSNISEAQYSFNVYPLYDENIIKLIVPTNGNAIIDPMHIVNQDVKFIMPFKPLYIGQQITINYDLYRQEIYKLNYKGELKERIYTINLGNDQLITKVKYRSLDKIFTLPLPNDLDTY